MFATYPTYSRYRTLQLTSPQQQGEDVFALQTALKGLGCDPGVPDGIFGPKTQSAVRAAQTRLGIQVDGLAGGGTQKALALDFALMLGAKYIIIQGALKGQIEHESSYRLGNYSVLYSNGSYDAGVVQRNTEHTPPPQGFMVPESIEALAANTRQHYDLFAGIPARRRWALAQGAWNAPAFACYIARDEGARNVTNSMVLRPTVEQRRVFENYVASVSAYLPL